MTVKRSNGPTVERKTHSNAWGEQFPEELRWELFALSKPPAEEEKESGRPWLRDYAGDVVPYLEGAGLEVPGRSAWYRFLGRMRCQERIRLVEQVASSARTAGEVARAGVDDGTAAETFKGLSIDAAMEGDAERSAFYARASAVFAERAAKAAELKLKAAAQATKEEQLRLAREKFEAAERRLDAAKGVIGDTKLSDGDKLAKMKEIFG